MYNDNYCDITLSLHHHGITIYYIIYAWLAVLSSEVFISLTNAYRDEAMLGGI